MCPKSISHKDAAYSTSLPQLKKTNEEPTVINMALYDVRNLPGMSL